MSKEMSVRRKCLNTSLSIIYLICTGRILNWAGVVRRMWGQLYLHIRNIKGDLAPFSSLIFMVLTDCLRLFRTGMTQWHCKISNFRMLWLVGGGIFSPVFIPGLKSMAVILGQTSQCSVNNLIEDISRSR